MFTAPQLLASALGHDLRVGSNQCFYCGAPCDDSHIVKEFVKDSFMGRGDVAAPCSQFVCHGCTLCLDERGTIMLADGEVREHQKRRTYSYVLTPTSCVSATKSHRDFLRQTCCSPPDPPFAIVISDSGQKHLLYRGVVNHSRDRIVVTLETEKIVFWPKDLVKTIDLCIKLIALTGKPALEEGLSFQQEMTVVEHLGEDVLKQWEHLSGSGMSRLAVWLSPSKEDSISELASHSTTAT